MPDRMGSVQHRCPRGTACVAPQDIAQDFVLKGVALFCVSFWGVGVGQLLLLQADRVLIFMFFLAVKGWSIHAASRAG